MCLGITCIVYSDVCLRYSLMEMLLFNCQYQVLCQSLRVSGWLQAHLAESAEIVCVGTGDWCHAAIHCVLCVGLPHCQHSAVPLLSSCTAILYTKLVTGNIFVSFQNVTWNSCTDWGELRHTQLVYIVRSLVCKIAMERTCRHIWDNDIIME